MKPFLSYIKENKESEKNIVISFSEVNLPSLTDVLFFEQFEKTADKLNADNVIFLNDIQDSKKNPLSYLQKSDFLESCFPNIDFVYSAKGKQEIINILNEHYDNVVVVDNSPVFNENALYHAKNNQYYDFKCSVPFISEEITLNLFENVRNGMGYYHDNTRGLYKAIFVTGGPGSGKDVVIRNSIAESRALELNSVQAYNYLSNLEKLNERTNDFKKECIRNRLPLIINCPADDRSSINYIKENLERIGYSTMMVFVDTTDQTSKERNQKLSRVMVESVRQDKWTKAQENKHFFKESFDEFMYFDNSKSDYELVVSISETYKKISNFFDNKAPTNSKFFVEDSQLKLKKFNFRAERPSDIPPDNRGNEPQVDNIKYDAQKRNKTYTFKTYSESAPTLNISPIPKEKNFCMDNDKKKKLKRGDKSLSAARVSRPSGIGPEYDTRAGGQGAAAGAGLGNQTYSEAYYSNDGVVNFAGMPNTLQPNPLDNKFDNIKKYIKKRNVKEAIDDPGAVDMGVSGTLGGASNKEPMQSYKDQDRNIGIIIKKKKKGVKNVRT